MLHKVMYIVKNMTPFMWTCIYNTVDYTHLDTWYHTSSDTMKVFVFSEKLQLTLTILGKLYDAIDYYYGM